MQGPGGRRDLGDVIELLTRQPCSKRAVLTLVGNGDGRVPCINAIHFLRREDGLLATYFARGQDMFRKYYADAICIHEMARRVAVGLGVPLRRVSGVISSAHVYVKDFDAIDAMLSDARADRRPAMALDGGTP